MWVSSQHSSYSFTVCSWERKERTGSWRERLVSHVKIEEFDLKSNVPCGSVGAHLVLVLFGIWHAGIKDRNFPLSLQEHIYLVTCQAQFLRAFSECSWQVGRGRDAVLQWEDCRAGGVVQVGLSLVHCSQDVALLIIFNEAPQFFCAWPVSLLSIVDKLTMRSQSTTFLFVSLLLNAAWISILLVIWPLAFFSSVTFASPRPKLMPSQHKTDELIWLFLMLPLLDCWPLAPYGIFLRSRPWPLSSCLFHIPPPGVCFSLAGGALSEMLYTGISLKTQTPVIMYLLPLLILKGFSPRPGTVACG